MTEYAIVANPFAGRMSRPQSWNRLSSLGKLLNCPIFGPELSTIEDFRACLKDLSKRCRVLIIAGGDGTFAEALNSLSRRVILGYLPFGTGNALNYALDQRCSSPRYVQSILRQESIPIRLMVCNGHRLSLMAGIGLDSEAMRINQKVNGDKPNTIKGYAKCFMKALSSSPPATVDVQSDQGSFQSVRNRSAMVTKHPFIGYGLKVSNLTELTEASLSLRLVGGSTLGVIGQLTAAGLFKTMLGATIKKGKYFHIKTDVDRWLQCDGDLIEKGREFQFEVLPEAQRVIY